MMSQNFIAIPVSSAVATVSFMQGIEDNIPRKDIVAMYSLQTFLTNPACPLQDAQVDGYALIDPSRVPVQKANYQALLKNGGETVVEITRANEQDNLTLAELYTEMAALRKDHQDQLSKQEDQISELRVLVQILMDERVAQKQKVENAKLKTKELLDILFL